MRTWGIKEKVLLLSLLPAILVAIALYGYFVNAQLGLLQNALDDHGITIAEQLGPAAEYGVATGNRELLERLASAVLKDESVIGVTIVDAGGAPMVRIGLPEALHLPLTPLSSHARLCHASGEVMEFCAPILRTQLAISDFEQDSAAAPEAIGGLYITLSSTNLSRRRAQAIVQALIITALLLGLTGVIAVRFGREISRPIAGLTTVVEQVSRGNLEASVDADADGELRILQSGINGMIAVLQASQHEMQGRIDAATAKLRLTLAELETKNRDLAEQREQAQQASTAKGQFLAAMSHEIRTPISGILGMLRLLKETELDSGQRDYLYNLELAAEALRSLIEDILDLSRIEAGKLALVEQTFDPRRVVTEVGLMLAPKAHEKGVEIICHLAPDFPASLNGDSVRLRQVLINLAANAIKFTERGEVVIRAAVVGDEGTVRFEILDTGIGIPKDKQATIFDSFTQADNSTTRRYGGSGLGITIARELIELMDGRIGVESEPGHGSLFWFELPLRDAVTAPDERPLDGQRVVVLEANAASRAALVDYCRALGATVESVADGNALLAMAAAADRAPIGTVIMAESRQADSCRELARALRAGPRGSELKLCHLTLFHGASDGDLYDCRLGKPVTLCTLQQKLLEIWHGKPAPPLRKAGGGAGTARALHLLVAEDDPINARVTSAFIEKAGHRAVVVGDGEAALAALFTGIYDAALVDVRMPGLDGLEVTRRWRAHEEGDERRLPIVALTANATTDDRDRCLAAGMDGFLAKPVELEQLTEMLANLV